MEWHKLVAECLKKHVGDRRPPARRQRPGFTKQHADFLIPAGFRLENFDYPTDFSWQIDEVVGYLHSISFASRGVLGDKYEAFERELRDVLSRANPSGVFHQRLDFFLTIAYKP